MGWPFADLEWWRYTLTTCLPSPPGPAPRFLGGPGESGDTPVSDCLRWLANCRHLNAESARCYLLRIKALKKWRLADPSFKGERRKKAMDGFLDRNSLALTRPCAIPWFLREHMRRWLARALPEPSGSSDGLGYHTSRKVAEHYTVAEKHVRLCNWVERGGSSWPYGPGNVYDMDHVVSRLSAVPKDWDKDRLITVEPSYSVWVQQAARRRLQDSIHMGSLRGTCMDLGYTDGAEIQRRLARSASRTGRLATLDLSNASDNISWSDVVEVFPFWVIPELESARSIACSVEDRVEPLGIYAGMGNATTFTVETLFFAAYVHAYAWAHNLPRFVSVFGDDIICHSETAKQLIANGQSACFVINAAKSFLGDDAVRESCGIYAYLGNDITAPKIDGYLPSWEGRLGVSDLHRRLAIWGPYGLLIASAIAQEGLLDNFPFLIDGYPSISDWSYPFTAIPAEGTRRNRDIQIREIKRRVSEPRERVIALNGDPVSRGFYYAWFSGKVRTVQLKHKGPCVKVPLPGWKVHSRWRRCEASSWGDYR